MRWRRELLVAAAAAAFAAQAAAGEVKCLTGNSRRRSDNSRVGGKYSVLRPGLTSPGWPKGPAQKDVPFSRGILTDGDSNTMLEWSDREFGSLGRDVAVDLGREYYVDRVEVHCKGNRLTGGTLYLKPGAGGAFKPVRRFTRDDFPTDADKRRKRFWMVKFHGVGAVARHLRVNVLGSHTPRFAEIYVYGRDARAGDARELGALLPYDPARLGEPKAVTQVPPPDPGKPFPSGEGPRFEFRGVRMAPPNKADGEFHKRYVRAVAMLKYNFAVHEGLNWAVNFKSWKTRYSKAIGVAELKRAIEFNKSIGLRTVGGWAVAPAVWALLTGDPSRVEARPGEAYLKGGRVDFHRRDGEILRKLSRCNACPLHPENLRTFKKVVDEICSIYTDEYFFGGVDEPLQWYNGSRWACCPRCKGKDPVKLMADWVNACSDHIRKKHGRIHMYQTTIILKEHQGVESGYPGGPKIHMYKIMDSMPKENTALVNWSYGTWKSRRGEPDSSGLNRYLKSKGYAKIIQNVGYTDSSFKMCDFTPWAGKQGADFIGATVANYGSQSLDDMARRLKFLDYAVTAQQLWNPDEPKADSREFASQLVNAVERIREVMGGAKLPSRAARRGEFHPVPISKHFNRGVVDDKPYDGKGWLDLGPGMDLGALPRGAASLCGHAFDLASGRCVMIEPKTKADAKCPSEVRGIAVGRKARSLLFLHCLTGRMERRESNPAIVYRVGYADGSSVDFPVRYRIEIMEWLDQSAGGGRAKVAADGSAMGGGVAKAVTGDMRIGWFLYGARPAWLGSTRSGSRAILYSAEWINPHPERRIRSVDMILPESSTAPGAALFAITAVGGD